jgi:tetratricopeptide (TPR) repeat protein
MALQQSAAMGLLALSRGETRTALDILHRAAAAEDSLGKHPVSPGALLPLRELYAEALLEAGRPAEALAQFEASLTEYPARFNALHGAGCAARDANRPEEARRHFEKLLTQTAMGDERPELAEARAYLGR